MPWLTTLRPAVCQKPRRRETTPEAQGLDAVKLTGAAEPPSVDVIRAAKQAAVQAIPDPVAKMAAMIAELRETDAGLSFKEKTPEQVAKKIQDEPPVTTHGLS